MNSRHFSNWWGLFPRSPEGSPFLEGHTSFQRKGPPIFKINYFVGIKIFLVEIIPNISVKKNFKSCWWKKKLTGYSIEWPVDSHLQGAPAPPPPTRHLGPASVCRWRNFPATAWTADSPRAHRVCLSGAHSSLDVPAISTYQPPQTPQHCLVLRCISEPPALPFYTCSTTTLSLVPLETAVQRKVDNTWVRGQGLN